MRKLMRAFATVAFVWLCGHGAANATCSVPVTLTNGTLADANKVMQNFNALVSCLNINLVVGPVTSTNGALAVFNNTTGGLLKNSGLTVSGSGNSLISPLGSLSATALQPTGNAATGLYFPDANSVALVGNGGVGITVDDPGTVTFTPEASHPVRFNAAIAGGQALVSFLDADVPKWQIGKQTDNSFGLYDVVNALLPLSVSAAGNTTLGEVGKTLTVNSTIKLTAVPSDAANIDQTLCLSVVTGTVLAGSGAAGVCLGTSSVRFKRDVVPETDGLAEVLRLKPVNFRYRKGYGDGGGREQYGFLAEDVVRVMPKLVGLDAEGRPLNLDYMALVPVLVKAVQEQQQQIDALRRHGKK
jgi:Chaperone of endosialidase